jgi:hypothetical protein
LKLQALQRRVVADVLPGLREVEVRCGGGDGAAEPGESSVGPAAVASALVVLRADAVLGQGDVVRGAGQRSPPSLL